MVNALTAEDWHMFKAMREQRMSISEIARRTGAYRKTVRKYIAMDKPERYSREGRRSVIAPYSDYVRGRIDKYNLSAVRIHDELKEKGFPGSYTNVKRLCRDMRKDRRIQVVFLQYFVSAVVSHLPYLLQYPDGGEIVFIYQCPDPFPVGIKL